MRSRGGGGGAVVDGAVRQVGSRLQAARAFASDRAQGVEGLGRRFGEDGEGEWPVRKIYGGGDGESGEIGGIEDAFRSKSYQCQYEVAFGPANNLIWERRGWEERQALFLPLISIFLSKPCQFQYESHSQSIEKQVLHSPLPLLSILSLDNLAPGLLSLHPLSPLYTNPTKINTINVALKRISYPRHALIRHNH